MFSVADAIVEKIVAIKVWGYEPTSIGLGLEDYNLFIKQSRMGWPVNAFHGLPIRVYKRKRCIVVNSNKPRKKNPNLQFYKDWRAIHTQNLENAIFNLSGLSV